MTSSTFTKEVQVPETVLWNFMKECGEWATLIPGYLHHEFPSNQEMIWVFKGDFGFIQKAIKLQLKVLAVKEFNRIDFELVGLSDNINGSGYFTMTASEEGLYNLTGSLNMEAYGFLAAMVNPVLEKFVPNTVEQLVESMAESVTQRIA